MVEFSPGFHRFLRRTLVEVAALSSFTFILSSFSFSVLFHLLLNFHFFKFLSFHSTLKHFTSQALDEKANGGESKRADQKKD